MSHDYFIKNISSKFLLISGEDCAEFLQGIITNDINKCKENSPIYACLLTPQGKFLADFFIIKFSYKYLIEIHEKYFEAFVNKLNMYKLRSKVDFQENTEIISLIIFATNTPLIDEKIILFQDPRNLNIGHKLYLNKNNFGKSKINNLYEKKYDLYKEILMKNLIPNTPDDLSENKSLLLENNFQNINAIDWNKGCYIGQEITARMKYRSLLKKQIYALELLSGNISPDDDIIQKDINIGSVISKTGKYVLCMLKINLIENKSFNKEQIKTDSTALLKFL